MALLYYLTAGEFSGVVCGHSCVYLTYCIYCYQVKKPVLHYWPFGERDWLIYSLWTQTTQTLGTQVMSHSNPVTSL